MTVMTDNRIIQQIDKINLFNQTLLNLSVQIKSKDIQISQLISQLDTCNDMIDELNKTITELKEHVCFSNFIETNTQNTIQIELNVEINEPIEPIEQTLIIEEIQTIEPNETKINMIVKNMKRRKNVKIRK